MRVSILANGQKVKCKFSMNILTVIENIISKHKNATMRIKSIDCLAVVHYKRVKKYCILHRIQKSLEEAYQSIMNIYGNLKFLN